MKQFADIIRELIEEDAYVRNHEQEIIRFYAGRALVSKRRPESVKDGTAAEPWTSEIVPLAVKLG